MNSKMLILAIACGGLAINSAASECIKPKYAREALQSIYLQQAAPGTDMTSIKIRVKPDEWKVIDRMLFDVYLCFGKNMKCPKEKASWDRAEHLASGNALLNAFWQSNRLKGVEKEFLQEKLRVLLEDSECSDF